MGAKQSCSRGVVADRCGTLSIFRLLLQFTRIGGTDVGNKELDNLFCLLLDTPINDVSYEAVETYVRNFVLHRLLNANLRKGNLYRYWERYAAFLEQILECESLTPSNPNDHAKASVGRIDNSCDGICHIVTVDSPLDSTNGGCYVSQPCENLLPSRDASTLKSPTEPQEATDTSAATTNEKSFKNCTGNDGTTKATYHDDNIGFGLYKRLAKETGNANRCLTPFVISKIFVKCLVDTINTVELLFHMDYLPYYLVHGSLSFFKLDIDECKDSQLVDIAETSSCNDLSDDQDLDTFTENDGIPKSCAEGMGPTADFYKYRDRISVKVALTTVESNFSDRKDIILRFCTEENLLKVKVPVGATLEHVADEIMTGAAKIWSSGTLEALRRGFCLIDERMRIFSLQNIGLLLDNAKEHLEFLVLPFCTSTYGVSGKTSCLQRLLKALFSYITSTITPVSSSHDIFLKASQSMVADVLVILLSSIVMKPYLYTTSKPEPYLSFPPRFGWIKNVPVNTRSVAPFYYIHMDCIRSQLMLEEPSGDEKSYLKPVIEYVLNYDDRMKYGLLDSLCFAIGTCGLEATARCLIRLLKAKISVGSKRYVVNLRNHVTLLLLLLLDYRESDSASYPDNANGYSQSPMNNFTSSVFTSVPSKVASVMERTGTTMSEVLQNQDFISDSSDANRLERKLAPELLADLAKHLLDINPSKLCLNELWLVLVDYLSQSRTFSYTFYAKANNFIKEVVTTIRRHSNVHKEKNDSYLVTKSPMLRTLIRILTHHIIHHKNNDIDDASLDMEQILQAVFDLFEWDYAFQKDDHLVNSLFLLINQLVEIPMVVNRTISEKILALLCTWMSYASTFIDAFPAVTIHVDLASLNCLMLVKMVVATLNVIKAALSPGTLDSNLDLIHAVLNHCTLDVVEDMLFHLKDPRFDATSELLKLGALRGQAVTLLDFLSLIVRTFMGFKMRSMYSFIHSKQTGFSGNGVVSAVSDLIREINEETAETKSALALAIARDFDQVIPPLESVRELFHYRMSQLWITAYSNQPQLTMWHYYANK